MGVAEPITQVTFPAFSRMRERGEDWRASFLTVLRLVALVTFPIGAFFSGAAEPIVDTLLRRQVDRRRSGRWRSSASGRC